VYWEQVTAKYFHEKVENRAMTAILPVGSVEAHGMHCPLGADNIAPLEFCRRLEARYPEQLIVLPIIPYGHNWELAHFSGTIAIPSRVFGEFVAETGKEVGRWGIKDLVIMNGHGGNNAALHEAMEDMGNAGMRTVLISWWLDYAQEIRTITSGQGHAGEDETAVMLALAPDWVHMEDATFNPYVPNFYVKGPGLHEKVLYDATTGDGRLATREQGEKILDIVTDRMAELLEDLWADRLFHTL
jgi:creatinine amidohydrolase